MTKKELIQEILSLDKSLSEQMLKSKTNNELKQMLSFAKHNSEEDENQDEGTVFFEADSKNEEAATTKLEDIEEPNILNRLSKISMERSVKPTIERNELITIMNITNGILVYTSRKSGMRLRFERYGDIEQIEFGELLTMRSSSRKFLDEPWLLVLDEEAVRYLGLESLYKKLVHPDDIDKIFALPLDRFREVVQNAPRGIAQLIIARAKERIENKTLDSLAKINIIEEKFNIELTS